ncbi:hypothetical protein Pmani_014574 [Petrolisthes manimaculis]|uniref:Uncharacterized protein n=1 Tax=Petrolisthes manimaculis TaxID=1843537 RepID=A0AAE1PVG4_9EUCA|nr:hypothetical protein Pmani_014574 [Petrolisthes manimaculis]
MICLLTNLLRHFGANEIMKGVGLGVVASSSWDQHTHTHTHTSWTPFNKSQPSLRNPPLTAATDSRH